MHSSGPAGGGMPPDLLSTAACMPSQRPTNTSQPRLEKPGVLKEILISIFQVFNFLVYFKAESMLEVQLRH